MAKKKVRRIDDIVKSKRVEDVIGKIKEEVDDTGEDVDYIKLDVEKIKREVLDTGEDVDEIKEDIDDLREDIQKLHKPSMIRAFTDKFEWDDFAQQIVGAVIFSAPFAVTEEVWRLAQALTPLRIVLIILLTITFDVLLLHYTKFKKMKSKRVAGIPLRLLSLMLVTYGMSAIILTLFGVIGGQVVTPMAEIKVVILVGLFANIGACTADLIR